MIRNFKAIDVEAEVCGAILPITWDDNEEKLTIRGVKTFAEAAAIIDALGRSNPTLGFRAEDIIPRQSDPPGYAVIQAPMKDQPAEAHPGETVPITMPVVAVAGEIHVPPTPPPKIGRDPELDRPSVEASAILDDSAFASMQSMKEVIQELIRRGRTDLTAIQEGIQDLHDSGACPMLLRIPELASRVVSTCTILKVPGTPGA